MMDTETIFKKMLQAAKLPTRASYRPREVCRLLSISLRQFHRLTERYTEDPVTGEPMDLQAINSVLLNGHRRVTCCELVDYIRRNQLFVRR
jgi:hypothetical protein